MIFWYYDIMMGLPEDAERSQAQHFEKNCMSYWSAFRHCPYAIVLPYSRGGRSVAQHNYVIMIWCYYDIMILVYYNIMILWYYDILILWYYDIMIGLPEGAKSRQAQRFKKTLCRTELFSHVILTRSQVKWTVTSRWNRDVCLRKRKNSCSEIMLFMIPWYYDMKLLWY